MQPRRRIADHAVLISTLLMTVVVAVGATLLLAGPGVHGGAEPGAAAASAVVAAAVPAPVLHGAAVVFPALLCVAFAWYACWVSHRALQRARALSGRLMHRSSHDALTGLPNRELFNDRLSMAIASARRRGERLGVLLLDLDGFKAVNDTHGHQIGDATLKEVAHRLRRSLRETDTAARLGGDEFALLVPGLQALHDAEGVARKVIEAIRQPMPLYGGRTYAVGASVGIAAYPDCGSEIDSIIKAADAAMYMSKAAGRNRFQVSPQRVPSRPANSKWMDFVDVFRVGVVEIDEQHDHIATLLNRLNTAVAMQAPTSEMVPQLAALIEYVAEHFATEERYMQARGYPRTREHKREHQSLIDEAVHLRQRFADGGELLVLQWLKDWLVTHVSGPDRALSEFLLAHGEDRTPDRADQPAAPGNVPACSADAVS